MRLEIRDRPYDLYAVVSASAFLVLIILIFPGAGVLRIVLGLPFILFFPGYVLISALYPERKRYFDKDGNEVPPPSEEEEGTNHDGVAQDRPYRKHGGKHASSGERRSEKETDEAPSEWPKGKGLDGLERVALSLGLSIAVTPLIGLVLNYTYDWAPDTLGIRLVPILVSQFAFILIVGGIAIYKRSRVPVEDRFAIVIDLKVPEDYTFTDKTLTVGIVLMMVLSVGMLVYIIVVPREGESFTEFYILGPNHKAEGYPGNLMVGESSFLYIGIGNHEHRDMNYTLVMSVDPSASNAPVSSLDNVTISRNTQPSMLVEVDEGKTREIQCNFSIRHTGSFKLRFLLFREGEEYRDLHIWTRVFSDGYLKNISNDQLEFYLAGEGGDPSLLPTFGNVEDHFIFSVGARNMLDEDVHVNMTIGLGDVPEFWLSFKDGSPVQISSERSLYMEFTINGTSSYGPKDVSLMFPEGEWDMEVSVRTGRGSVVFIHEIMVGGG
ncbi:MAG: DUF1616 domain-containing protein [Thermoplasmatota archaeon]